MENFLWVSIPFRSAQSKYVPEIFPIILKDFDQIIEIGTFTGAFTYWLSENKSEHCSIKSYDINGDYRQINNVKDTEFMIGDCFDLSVMNQIVSFLKEPKRTLFLCDGGDKETEFKLYSRYLKPNDVIMLHDYSHNDEEYEKIKREINWPTQSESHYKNLERYLPELKLEPYFYDDFKKVLWGSFIKK